MQLLLLSNSTNHGSTMFSHAAEALVELVGDDPVTFILYALAAHGQTGGVSSARGAARGAPRPARTI